jgi:hypothetical protein
LYLRGEDLERLSGKKEKTFYHKHSQR